MFDLFICAVVFTFCTWPSCVCDLDPGVGASDGGRACGHWPSPVHNRVKRSRRPAADGRVWSVDPGSAGRRKHLGAEGHEVTGECGSGHALLLRVKQLEDKKEQRVCLRRSTLSSEHWPVTKRIVETLYWAPYHDNSCVRRSLNDSTFVRPAATYSSCQEYSVISSARCIFIIV